MFQKRSVRVLTEVKNVTVSYIFDLRLHVITYLLFSFFHFSFHSVIALVFYF